MREEAKKVEKARSAFKARLAENKTTEEARVVTKEVHNSANVIYN